MSEHHDAERRDVPKELERALAAEVSLRARMRHTAIGLAGGCGAALIAVLWATEPHPLPVRTQVAFAALITVGLAWATFAGWVLTRRRPLYARDRVLGARLALTVTVLTGVASTTLAAVRGTPTEALTIALTGTALVITAGLLLLRAHARRRELLRLRNSLQTKVI
ncbi:transmembrane transport protein [Streptomyces sp. NPDC001002]